MFPVSLGLGGATQDSSGSLDILVGQKCVPSLTVGESIDSRTFTGTLSNYQWSVTGTTFQKWSVGANSAGQAQGMTNYIGGPGTVTTNPAGGWYWNDAQNTPETVTCSVTVTPPAGQGAAFTMTVTQKVSVMVPTWKATGTGGYMQVNTKKDGANYWLWAGPTQAEFTAGFGRGMTWIATVNTPQTPVAFGTGQIEVVQVITSNDSYITNTVPQVTHNDPNNGTTGLDAFYPYVSPTNEPGTLTTGDIPGIEVLNSIRQATYKSSFMDYLLYEPPASSQFVPLADFPWSTNGTATIPISNLWSGYVAQNGSDAAGTISPSGTANFSGSNAFPQWTSTIVAHPY